LSIPVCIFAKPPVAGAVKTRLAAVFGDNWAAELARAMLHDVWAVVTSAPGALPVLAATEHGSFGFELPDNRLWLQRGADLGTRIESILGCGLGIAPAVIALGADTPLFTHSHLADVLEQLESGNAVLGPCDDGGFFLLALHSCPPGLLAGIPWSCERTCDATEMRLRSCGMQVARIRSSFDIDMPADVHRLRRELADLPPEIAPRTRKLLDAREW
jgi:rSAM/selenodomain-associated transferase 1